MLLHLLPGALFWSIIFHHYAGSAIMNNEKKEKRVEKKQNIKKETVFELSQLPQRWWCLLWLNVESWRDGDVSLLQHYKKDDSVIETWIQWVYSNWFHCMDMCKLCHLKF